VPVKLPKDALVTRRRSAALEVMEEHGAKTRSIQNEPVPRESRAGAAD